MTDTKIKHTTTEQPYVVSKTRRRGIVNGVYVETLTYQWSDGSTTHEEYRRPINTNSSSATS